MLRFGAERDRRVDEYRRLIQRIDDALEGRAGPFRTATEALEWVRGEEPLPEGKEAPGEY